MLQVTLLNSSNSGIVQTAENMADLQLTTELIKLDSLENEATFLVRLTNFGPESTPKY